MLARAAGLRPKNEPAGVGNHARRQLLAEGAKELYWSFSGPPASPGDEVTWQDPQGLGGAHHRGRLVARTRGGWYTVLEKHEDGVGVVTIKSFSRA
jgi:hypothetical protein